MMRALNCATQIRRSPLTRLPLAFKNRTQLNKSTSISGDVINLVRGFCMGAADTVPGISGGTVALVLGHYERLLGAISHFDTHALSLATKRRWSDLANYCDLRFIFALGVGIVLGAGSLAAVMHHLLEHQMSPTLAVFFGLVLASGWLVAKQIKTWNANSIVAIIIGAVFAYWICTLTSTGGNDNLLYLFLSAAVAICAMILPGISGAFVLLLLGMYHPVMGMIKQFAKGDITFDIVLRLCVFAAGCLFGLLAFSRLLKWLLRDYPESTMACLLGLMIGSLRRVWPLQSVTDGTAMLPFKERTYDLVSPANWQGSLLLPLSLAIGAGVFVIVIEKVAGRLTPSHQSSHKTQPA